MVALRQGSEVTDGLKAAFIADDIGAAIIAVLQDTDFDTARSLRKSCGDLKALIDVIRRVGDGEIFQGARRGLGMYGKGKEMIRVARRGKDGDVKTVFALIRKG